MLTVHIFLPHVSLVPLLWGRPVSLQTAIRAGRETSQYVRWLSLENKKE